MGKQLDMFPGEPGPPREAGMVAELAAAHRAPKKRETTGKRRDGLSELFCPSCGSRIALDLAKALAR